METITFVSKKGAGGRPSAPIRLKADRIDNASEEKFKESVAGNPLSPYDGRL